MNTPAGGAARETCSFQDLLLAEMPRLHAYARKLIRNRSLAEDLLQQTALRAWRGRAQFAPGTNFTAWIYRILRNEFISTCRRAKRAPRTSGNYEEDVQGYGGDQEDKVMAQEVRDAVDALPPSYCDVLYLKYLSDHSYEEVAALLNCSVAAIKSRIWRARKALHCGFIATGAVPRPPARQRSSASNVMSRSPEARAG